jgi:hypothetical protein
VGDTVQGTKQPNPGNKELVTWQAKLLPVMVRMVIGLTIFFFAASFFQLLFLHQHIARGSNTQFSFVSSPTNVVEYAEGRRMDVLRWNTVAALEQYSLVRRHNQATVLLMARVWTHYLGFVTGMISMMIGAVFILGKLQEQAAFTADTPAWKFSLTTASPGLVLSLLGTILMVTTMATPARIEVEDRATFLGSWNGSGQQVHLPDELLTDVPTTRGAKPTIPASK